MARVQMGDAVQLSDYQKSTPQRIKLRSNGREKGGDSIGAGLGSVWLTDLRAGVIWRMDPALQ